MIAFILLGGCKSLGRIGLNAHEGRVYLPRGGRIKSLPLGVIFSQYNDIIIVNLTLYH